MRKNLINKAVLLLMLFAFAGLQYACVSTKNIPVKPDWLINRPINPSGYIGIGSAAIGTNSIDYQQIAKRNALNDLASEISITISNTSFLHKLAVNDVFTESFDSRTQTSINENLEGYELVSTFADKTTYWAYYTLSKSTYQSLKLARIEKALDNAKSKFTMAKEQKNNHQYHNALILFVKAVEDLKPYLAEPLITNYEGREMYFGNELFNEIYGCISEMKITATHKEVSVRRGQPLDALSLTFVLTDANGNALENIPVAAEFSGNGLINGKAQSDRNGNVSFSIPKIKSKKDTEHFTAKIDLEALLQEATNDFIIKKLLKNINTGSATIQTTIQNPVFYIESTENGLPKDGSVLKKITEELLVAAVCEMTNEKSEADFVLSISAASKKLEENGKAITLTFDAQIIVKNQQQKTLYQRNITNINATQNTFETANKDVYTKGGEYLKSRVIPDVLSNLFE